jgi:probable H4MPT-linked C1 transfer pathway protein
MTGELCDCFATKRQGVHTILKAVAAVAADKPVRVWQTDGRLVSLEAACSAPLQVAAANWLALATFAGRLAPTGSGLLIDIGSTTTDLIPLDEGKPAPLGRTDPDRFRSGELVYTGIRRTPLCALLGGRFAAELFATTLDAYLVLEKVPEDPSDCLTADGRPATRAAAHARLARMMCADMETCTEKQTFRLAQRVERRQVRLIQRALRRVQRRMSRPPGTIILAGSGEFLAHSVVARRFGGAAECISLTQRFGPAIAGAACAYALAVIAAENA